jgi:hypothetical protein
VIPYIVEMPEYATADEHEYTVAMVRKAHRLGRPLVVSGGIRIHEMTRKGPSAAFLRRARSHAR